MHERILHSVCSSPPFLRLFLLPSVSLSRSFPQWISYEMIDEFLKFKVEKKEKKTSNCILCQVAQVIERVRERESLTNGRNPILFHLSGKKI